MIGAILEGIRGLRKVSANRPEVVHLALRAQKSSKRRHVEDRLLN